MPRRNLQGQRAIVTGSSGGIGRELAQQLAEQGARVIITGRRGDKLNELAQHWSQQPDQVIPVAGDVTDADHRQHLIETALARWDGLDLLINNAGIGAFGPFRDASPERLRTLMEVNFFAPVELTRLALPVLAKSPKGMIVNVGSVLGHVAVPLKSEYCATKFALRGFSDALRAELRNAGIDVLHVSPSTTNSEFFENVIEDPTQRDWKRFGAMQPAEVARQTLRAIRRGQRELILSTGGRLLCLAQRFFPGLTARLVARGRK